MPRKHLIICLDCAANLSADRWEPLLEKYQCEMVESSHHAVQIIATRCVDAIVAACPIAATNLIMHLKSLRRETPVVLLGDNELSRCAPSMTALAVESVPDVASLLVLLHERLATPSRFPVALQPFDVGQLHWRFSVLAERSGNVVVIEGVTVTLGKGGLHGKMAGTLHMGETVLVEFPNTPEAPMLRAQVRSRHQDVYGLTFETNRQ
jgi:hypothetical protein